MAIRAVELIRHADQDIPYDVIRGVWILVVANEFDICQLFRENKCVFGQTAKLIGRVT